MFLDPESLKKMVLLLFEVPNFKQKSFKLYFFRMIKIQILITYQRSLSLAHMVVLLWTYLRGETGVPGENSPV